jgi:recombination protein U
MIDRTQGIKLFQSVEDIIQYYRKKNRRDTMSQANRGMAFEQLIDYTNKLYEQKGIALINKRPTPVKILCRNSKGMIHGYLEKPSTVDYDGIYNGKSIVFEAKSTKEFNRFDLKNIHDHQFEYLAKCHKLGAISFLLVEFVSHRTTYLMPFETLECYWTRKLEGGRGTQSISIEEFDVHTWQVSAGQVPIDYLKIVNELWKVEVA